MSYVENYGIGFKNKIFFLPGWSVSCFFYFRQVGIRAQQIEIRNPALYGVMPPNTAGDAINGILGFINGILIMASGVIALAVGLRWVLKKNSGKKLVVALKWILIAFIALTVVKLTIGVMGW